MSSTRSPSATELPPAGTWHIDPGHAEIAFIGRHFGLTKVRGRFTDVDGLVVIADDPTRSTIEVTIDMASVSSGDQSRDDHLRSDDFFDVDHHPVATYRSTSVAVNGTSGIVDGELTLRSVTRPVRLEVSYLGHVVDPWGNDRIVFTASSRIDREDWGLTWNMPLDAGGLVVSKQITIEIELELVQQPA